MHQEPSNGHLGDLAGYWVGLVNEASHLVCWCKKYWRRKNWSKDKIVRILLLISITKHINYRAYTTKE